MNGNVSWDDEGGWQAGGAWGNRDARGRNFDLARWQARFDELRAACRVPGAALAVLVNGEIHELASGVLHRGTGVEVTTDSVFLCGSIAKTYTATLVMTLVDEGLLALDTRVVDVLPEFATPDPEATGEITIRHLLSHTGGVTNDFNHDGGRGDDCLADYVKAARDVALDCAPGMATSYGGLGFITLGRVVEVVTGMTWDRALRERVLAPLGLEHSITLPEEALRFRVAMSHLGEGGQDPDPAPAWDLMPRSMGPAGRIISSAGDMARFARMHLDGGLAPDGTRVLTAESVAAMRDRQVEVPDKWTVSADGWGLGWTLYDWDGVTGYGHDGAAIGQYGYLRVVPSAGVAVVLLTNGGGARRLYYDLFRELLAELAGVRMPEPFAAPAVPPAIDVVRFAGTYKRAGVVVTVGEKGGVPHMRYEFVDDMEGVSPPLEMEMTPVMETGHGTVFAASGAGPSFSEEAMPVVFATLKDGTECVYVGMRVTPKAA